ncbi:MAG: chloride channel protein [bacterium]|jgi:H+/Cl- antiporter ClcA
MEIKCILAGLKKGSLIDFRVLVTKYLSTMFMMAAGFPFGLIATHIHLGACIAYNL